MGAAAEAEQVGLAKTDITPTSLAAAKAALAARAAKAAMPRLATEEESIFCMGWPP